MTRRSDAVDPVALGGATLQWFNDHAAEGIFTPRRIPPEEGGALPVIAVTAYATSEDRRTALRAGFYAHVPKPFVPEHLISTIARAVELTT
jgi:CheY-like chemotaxis protein